MDKKKIKEIDKLLQRLMDRKMGWPEKTAPPKRACGGSGNIIRRRKGQPDKRLVLPSCSQA